MHTVALFADRWILPGLHVTLKTLLKHADDTAPLRVIVFGEGLSRRARDHVRRTAETSGRPHRLEFRTFETPLAGRVRALHGNYTTYGRLFLPDLIPDTDVCLYLDCDLIVTRSFGPLFDRVASGAALYGEGSGIRRTSLDSPTLAALGFDLSGTYFNAGVLLFNLRRWRDEQLTRRCVDFALEPPAPLISHDQTILNCLMADRFEPFDSSYNTFLWPDTPAVAPHARRGRVFHLVGAPKPWNYLGTYANKNATWWYELARETAWGQHWPSRLMSRLGLTREVRLARSTFRALMRR